MDNVQDSDRALENSVRRAVRGDREAFGQLYDLYVDRIYKYIYYRLGNPAEAEDLTAEVFTRAWEAIGRFKEREGGFPAWLFRIAHNLLVDHFRTRRETLSLEELEPVGEETPGFEQMVEKGEIQRMLSQALGKLTAEQQQVILLRFIAGYSSEEVAKMMSKSEEAVRALQYRALTSLSRILEKEKKQ